MSFSLESAFPPSGFSSAFGLRLTDAVCSHVGGIDTSSHTAEMKEALPHAMRPVESGRVAGREIPGLIGETCSPR